MKKATNAFIYLVLFILVNAWGVFVLLSNAETVVTPGYTTIQKNGENLPKSRTLNIAGSAATCTGTASRTTCTFSGGQVDSVVAGTNITVDSSDPANPVVSAASTTTLPFTALTGSATDAQMAAHTGLNGTNVHGLRTMATETAANYSTTAQANALYSLISHTQVFTTITGSVDPTQLPAGTGNVSGPASASNEALTVFSGPTGKIITSANGTGAVRIVNGVVSVVASGPTYSILATNATGSSISAYFTALTYTPEISKNTILEGRVMFSSNAAPFAAQFRVRSAEAQHTGNCHFHQDGTASTALSATVAMGINPADTAATATAINVDAYVLRFWCGFVASPTPAQLFVEFQSEAAATITVYAGSYLSWTQTP